MGSLAEPGLIPQLLRRHASQSEDVVMELDAEPEEGSSMSAEEREALRERQHQENLQQKRQKSN